MKLSLTLSEGGGNSSAIERINSILTLLTLRLELIDLSSMESAKMLLPEFAIAWKGLNYRVNSVLEMRETKMAMIKL